MEQLLFRCHSSDPLEHPSYRHMVVLSNLYNTPLRFCVHTQAPFSITALAPSVPQERGAAEGDKFHQAVFELPPRENLNVEVQFEPPEGGLAGAAGLARGAAASASSSTSAAGGGSRTRALRGNSLRTSPTTQRRPTTRWSPRRLRRWPSASRSWQSTSFPG